METIKDRLVFLRHSEGLTQAEFGDKLRYSRDVVKNIEYGKTDPKEMFVKRVCEVFHVNRSWLETGEGEMYENLTEDLELADFVGNVLASSTADFRKRLLIALSRLSPEEWSVLERVADSLANAQNEKDED